jgi:hypothetical protein
MPTGQRTLLLSNVESMLKQLSFTSILLLVCEHSRHAGNRMFQAGLHQDWTCPCESRFPRTCP